MVFVGAVFMIPMCFAISILLGIPREWRFSFILTLAALLSFVLSGGVKHLIRWVNSSVKVGLFFTHSNAEPRIVLSGVEAKIAAGYFTAAALELDALLRQHGLDERVCRLAVDFHLGKHGSRERGETLLKRMRVERPAQYELYATQRLIDLYIATSAEHGKAIAEMRRVIARFPGTPEAMGATLCIERLRATEERATA